MEQHFENHNFSDEEKRKWARDRYEQLEMRLDKLEGAVQKLNEQQQVEPPQPTIEEQEREEHRRLMQINRKERERKKKYDLEAIARTEYMHFCFWCNTTKAILRAGGNGAIDVSAMQEQVYTNEKIFVEYMQTEKPSGFKRLMPDFAIKKKMFEMFFGYTFEYDTLTNKWRAYKKN